MITQEKLDELIKRVDAMHPAHHYGEQIGSYYLKLAALQIEIMRTMLAIMGGINGKTK